MSSVRARAALGATLVAAVALIAAGFAVLLVLRSNLIDQTDLQAEVAARAAASQIALDVPYDKLDLPDGENRPVQIVDEAGRVLAVCDGLEAVSGAGSGQAKPQDGSPGEAEEEDDDDPRRGEVSADEPRFGSGSATVDGDSARTASPPSRRPPARTAGSPSMPARRSPPRRTRWERCATRCSSGCRCRCCSRWSAR
jgi:hypothetical protein